MSALFPVGSIMLISYKKHRNENEEEKKNMEIKSEKKRNESHRLWKVKKPIFETSSGNIK